MEDLRTTLPGDYLELLRSFNGAEGTIGAKAYLVLWSAEEVLPANQEYHVYEFMPGAILIGGNGANAAYGIDARKPGKFEYVETDLIGGLDWDSIFFRCDSLYELLFHLCEL